MLQGLTQGINMAVVEMSEEEASQRSAAFMSPMQQYGSSILELTNPQNELLKMELTFRAMILDKDGNERQIGKPLMNEEGISSVIGQVQSLVNQVTIMSNFKDNDIPMMVEFLGDTLAKDLMMNRIAYKIESTSSRDKIYFSALATTFVTLKRALNNGERGFWKGSQQDIRQFIETGNKPSGLLGGLFGWNKRSAGG